MLGTLSKRRAKSERNGKVQSTADLLPLFVGIGIIIILCVLILYARYQTGQKLAENLTLLLALVPGSA